MGLHIEKRSRLLYLTMERPPLNVLDLDLLDELNRALVDCAGDTGVDVVVLQGAGTRAFSAGVDIRDHSREKVPEMLAVVHGVIRRLLALPQATVAAVRGVCLGGGCEIASSCDFVVASEDSSFGTPEITVGCYPPVALARFSSLLGYHQAAEMILTGRRYTAREALGLGLVNRVAGAEQFDSALAALTEDLLAKSGAVLRIAVKGLRELSRGDFFEALDRSEQIYCQELLRTEDVEEGVRAFVEKRKPEWKHR